MTAEAPTVAEISSLWVDIRSTLEAETGMNLSDEREERLTEAFRNFVRQNHLATPAAIRQRLLDPQKRMGDIEQLVAQLTVGETYFFRNADHFRALRETVIPSLITAHENDRTLRIWSAGCATGEEAYSIGILIHRDFPALADWNIHILATDISKEFLERGGHGRYRAWSFRQTDVNADSRYFKKSGDEFVLNEKIRNRVRFHHLNLVYDVYPSPYTQTAGLDLILFRNVAIYLKEDVSKRIVQRFARCLRPGGWLLIGEVEISQNMYSEEHFEKVRDGEAILLRRRADGAAPTLDPTPIVPIWQTAIPAGQYALPAGAAFGIGLPAAPAYENARFDIKQTEPAASKVRRAIDVGDLSEAQKHLPRILDLKKRAAMALEMARMALGAGQARHALDYVQSSIEWDPLHVDSYLLSASLAEESGDIQTAASTLKRALYIDKNCLMAHLLLGMIQRRAGDSDAARVFRNALSAAKPLDPGSIVPYSDGMCVGRYVQMVEQLS